MPSRTTKDRRAADIWARTQMLAEVLLQVMENEMRAQGEERSEEWLRSFGAKDSAMANLQKLVQLLAALQAYAPPKRGRNKVERVDLGELEILADWLRTEDASAANVSPAAE